MKMPALRRLRSIDVVACTRMDFLASTTVTQLTLRVDLSDQSAELLPAIASVERLSLIIAWCGDLTLPARARIDLSRFNALSRLGISGGGPPKYLDGFSGYSSTMKSCCLNSDVIYDARSTAFFSRFSKNLQNLSIAGGSFTAPILSQFESLRAMHINDVRVEGRPTIPKCPQLQQLMIEGSSNTSEICHAVSNMRMPTHPA